MSIFALVIGLLMVGAGPAQAATYPLKSVTWGAWTLFSQQESNWCWAAGAKIVIKHKQGSAPSQCALVKRGKDLGSCSNVTGTMSNMAEAIRDSDQLAWVYGSTPSWLEIRGTTATDNLGLLTRVVWDSGGKIGHIAPIVGSAFDGEMVRITHIRTTGVSSSWISYSQFKNGTAGLGSAYTPSGGWVKG